MATKRTGRPRGRPQKPKADEPAQPRGRPSGTLWSHPRRFEVAVFKAAELCLRLQSRSAAKGLVAIVFGEPAPLDPRRPEKERWSVPLSLKSFQQNADRLRKLAARFPKTPPEVIWLSTICQVIAIGFFLGPHAKEAAKQLAFSYAAGVGEERWARERLLPWIESMRTPADFKADRETLARFFEDFLSQGA